MELKSQRRRKTRHRAVPYRAADEWSDHGQLLVPDGCPHAFRILPWNYAPRFAECDHGRKRRMGFFPHRQHGLQTREQSAFAFCSHECRTVVPPRPSLGWQYDGKQHFGIPQWQPGDVRSRQWLVELHRNNRFRNGPHGPVRHFDTR